MVEGTGISTRHPFHGRYPIIGNHYGKSDLLGLPMNFNVLTLRNYQQVTNVIIRRVTVNVVNHLIAG